MKFSLTGKLFNEIKYYSPDAVAVLKGSSEHPLLRGKVSFWQTKQGCLITAEVEGLPQEKNNVCTPSIFAFHIHEGEQCSGTPEDPFAETKGHYNPQKCDHPNHAGDLPPLFSNQGWAWMAVVTNRFSLKEILGKTVVIHEHADDFKTQPSGDSGKKIACGVIRATWN